MSKLFEGISECKLGAIHVVGVLEKLSVPSKDLEDRVKRDLSRSLAEVISKSDKIVLTERFKQRSMHNDSETEYSTELYVFTRNELETLIANVRRDEQERFIPRT